MMSNEKTKKLLAGSAMRVVEFVVSALVALAVTPFMIHSLGNEMFGLWVFICSILGNYFIMDFGIGSAVERYVSQSSGTDDRAEINKLINTGLVIYTAIGLGVLLISCIVGFGLPLLMKNITDAGTFKLVMILLGLGMALKFPFGVFKGVLHAHVRYDLTARVGLIVLFVRTFFIVVFLKAGYGLKALSVIVLISDVSLCVIYYYMARNLYKYIELSRKLFCIARVKKLFGYSVYTFIDLVADQLKYNIDNFVIVAFIGLNPVTVYSVGTRLIRNFIMFTESALGVAMPMFSSYEGKGDYDSIREKYLLLTKISMYLSLFIGGGLIVFGKAFIIRWVGPEYIKAYDILLIFLIPCMFATIQIPSSDVIYGISKHKYFAIAHSIEAVCNVVLSLILVRYYGIYGVALGTGIPMLIIKVFIQPVYTCRILGLKSRRFYVDLLMPILLLAVFTYGFFWFMVKDIIMPGYFNILALSVLVAFIYLSVMYVFGLNQEEKRVFRRAILGADPENYSEFKKRCIGIIKCIFSKIYDIDSVTLLQASSLPLKKKANHHDNLVLKKIADDDKSDLIELCEKNKNKGAASFNLISFFFENNYDGFVAFLGDDMIGYVFWVDNNTTAGKTHPEVILSGIKLKDDEIYLFDFFVAPEFRGNNNAIEFLNKTCVKLETQGYRKIYGIVDPHNLGALWVYKVLGGKTVGKIIAYRYFSFILRINKTIFLKTGKKYLYYPHNYSAVYPFKNIKLLNK